jgi:hypothetical protein
MRPRSSDHKVLFTREETIAAAAQRLLQDTGYYNVAYFNITDFIKGDLAAWLEKSRSLYLIVDFSAELNDPPAYVDFEVRKGNKHFAKAILHVDAEIWHLAEIGDPTARYILAHEIGHLVLHDCYAQAFTNDPADQISFAINEFSAEWQANTFADYFLLPTHKVQSIGNVEGLLICGVTMGVAKSRFETVFRAKYCGDACAECGNFTLLPYRSGWKCQTCENTQSIFTSTPATQ